MALVGLVSVAIFGGCSGKETMADTPDALFNEAEEDFKDERYISALERYRELKNRFPYSSRSTDAELRIADTYFGQESYLEAESAYEIFKELHPTHPKIDYVQYRIGLSNFNQIPDNTARDLSAAQKSIGAFEVLLERFPSSQFVEKAKSHITDAKKALAEHENYVANFYYQKRHYLSASYRYAALLNDYPNLGYDELALYRLGESYAEIRMFGNARDALRRLLAKYPDSSYKSASEALLKDIKEKN